MLSFSVGAATPRALKRQREVREAHSFSIGTVHLAFHSRLHAFLYVYTSLDDTCSFFRFHRNSDYESFEKLGNSCLNEGIRSIIDHPLAAHWIIQGLFSAFKKMRDSLVSSVAVDISIAQRIICLRNRSISTEL